ncbi:MAG: integrase [Pelagerythrobacter marensis]|nr:MAG: integrase [Pelagerythrobacter marensis]
MPKIKLDAQECLLASCPEGKSKEVYTDTVTTGFLLECRPGGGKTYHLRYSDQRGRLRQIKIGGYHDITFDQARKKAKQLRSEVTLGGDPAAKKEVLKAIPTYANVAEQHIAHAKAQLRASSSKGTERIIKLHIEPRFGKMRLDEITQRDVARWLAEKRASGLAPATVEKLRVVLHRSFELAASWGLPGSQPNPVKGITKPKYNNARERYLSPDEAARLHKSVAASSNPQLKNIVGLLLLTGARKRELLDARWEHIHLDRKSWYIPDSKTGKARHVPLSQSAIAIIKQLPKYAKCPWLLPNPDTKKPFVDIKRAWETARDAAGLAGLRIHDLRHSAASFMINSGIDLYAVGRVLGHADHQSTMRYSHLANDTLLAAVEAGAAKLNVQWAAGEGSANGL